ncbi:MAG: ATP-binding protein [Tractidigestivibacter sp.]|jgi:uncharacterized membrane protein|uniref:ATP-binding protein n=1 Tax=Tractidigestivibacter sp. TaxID=2847320 RepID=UPI003D8A2EDB
MVHSFYPFVENGGEVPNEEDKPQGELGTEVRYPARIAVYDDAAAAPRVVVVEPNDIRSYLEEITATVNKLAHEQGGQIPFTVIREIVENFIHAYFIAPTITILDNGNTLRFSDQGPGIKSKELALEYGTTSATEEMKHYIRGVGSGLPYVQQYMTDKGGSLTIEDNISGGTVVTISTRPGKDAMDITHAQGGAGASQQPMQQQFQQAMQPQQPQFQQPMQPQVSQGYSQTSYQQVYAGMMPQQSMPQMPPSQQYVPATPTQAPVAQGAIALSERGAQILKYLSEHEMVGPSDLVRAYGLSAPTWSRELVTLLQAGIVKKVGQKYHLTKAGEMLI